MASQLNSFLSHCAASVQRKECVTLVMGNEGGDMDSVIGSVFLSYLLAESRCWTGVETPVPILNFAPCDFSLRKDIVEVFKKYDVDPSNLLFACGDPFAMAENANVVNVEALQAKVVLFDHNSPCAAQKSLAATVTGIVDHHADEGDCPNCPPSQRIIETVGSACTLVGRLFRENNIIIPIPEMLLCPITLDTVNFDESHGKVTPMDVEIKEWLLSFVSPPIDVDQLYQTMKKNKKNIFSFTLQENLRRDYKSFLWNTATGVPLSAGISSIPCVYEKCTEKYGTQNIFSSCRAWSETNSLDVCMIMFSGKRKEVQSDKAEGKVRCRELLVIGELRSTEWLTGFCATTELSVGLSKISETVDDCMHCILYNQRDVNVSRKKLTPLMGSYLQQYELPRSGL